MNDKKLFAELTQSATRSLKIHLPSSFSLVGWSPKADAAWRSQWKAISSRTPPNGGWNWPACVNRRARDPTALCAAMWCQNEQELCGLTLVRLNGTACWIEMMEGSPDPSHSLRGLVHLLALELASMYAQATGRRDVWLHRPANDMLLRYYLDVWGFALAKPKNAPPFCRREV